MQASVRDLGLFVLQITKWDDSEEERVKKLSSVVSEGK